MKAILWVFILTFSITLLAQAKKNKAEPTVKKATAAGRTPKTPRQQSSGLSKDMRAWSIFDDDKGYTAAVLHELGTYSHCTPKVLEFKTGSDFWCSGYQSMNASQRAIFLVALVKAMVEKESSFDLSAQYKEAFPDSSGKPVMSKGLLSLSHEAVQPDCKDLVGTDRSETAENLKNGKLNIQCGTRMLCRYLNRSNVVAGKETGDKAWKGAAAYWAPMRISKMMSEAQIDAQIDALKKNKKLPAKDRNNLNANIIRKKVTNLCESVKCHPSVSRSIVRKFAGAFNEHEKNVTPIGQIETVIKCNKRYDELCSKSDDPVRCLLLKVEQGDGIPKRQGIEDLIEQSGHDEDPGTS